MDNYIRLPALDGLQLHRGTILNMVEKRSFSWCLAWILLLSIISLANSAEVLRIPLIRPEVAIQRNAKSRSPWKDILNKRAIGYAPLVDDVSPQFPDIDFEYLGNVSIGTPPQSFLVRIIFVARG